MNLFLSAAEASADLHGAQLLKALNAHLHAQGKTLSCFGIGGPSLEKEGMEVIVKTENLLVMGITEVFSRLPRILSILNRVTRLSKERKPDLAILIDYPGFHFKLGKRLKKMGIPVVYFIPPKVWVWKKWRIKEMKKFVDLVLCIFPFEEALYRENGIPALYVGNPLSEEIPRELSREGARKELGISESDRVIVLMPGSRPSEVRNHFDIMLEAVRLSLPKTGPVKILISLSSFAVPEQVEARLKNWAEKLDTGKVDVIVKKDQSHLCLRAADAGIVKSGTSTLEAALLGCPHVVMYKPNFLTAWIFKNLLSYKGPVGMVNIFLGTQTPPYIFPECLCDEANAKRISEELVRIFEEDSVFNSMNQACESLRSQLLSKRINERAAEVILEKVPLR